MGCADPASSLKICRQRASGQLAQEKVHGDLSPHGGRKPARSVQAGAEGLGAEAESQDIRKPG